MPGTHFLDVESVRSGASSHAAVWQIVFRLDGNRPDHGLSDFMQGRSAMNIYVGNLSFDTTDSKLQAEFETFGSVSKVNIVADRDTGRPRGFAFVEMEDGTQAKSAIDGLNGKQIDGRAITVNEARPRTGAPRGRSNWRP